MYTDIILLTKHYPFGNSVTPGETYLESEIGILSSQANNVYVFACDASSNMTLLEDLPMNVHAYALCSGGAWLLKIYAAVCGLLFFLKAPAEVIMEAKRKSLRQRLFLYYFASRAAIRLRSIRKAINQNMIRLDADVLIYSYWFYDYSRAGLLLKDKIKRDGVSIRCVSRAHRYDLYAYTNAMNYLPLRPWLLDNLDWVFPCSKDGSNYLKTLYPLYGDKIVEMYIGTPDLELPETEFTRSVFRIASCSQVTPIKRVDVILNTIATLIRTGYKVEWAHVGAGPDWEKLNDEVSRLRQELGVDSFVLLGGMKNKDVLSYYITHPFDLFLNVSISEGLPISIMEAISFGIPVIATDVGGTSEIVHHGDNGYLLPESFTQEQLVDKIIGIINMPNNSYMQMRRNARKSWEVNFRAASNALKMIEHTKR